MLTSPVSHLDGVTKRVSKLLAWTALLVAVCAACGNSSDDKTVVPSTDGRLTKAEYITHGDANCAQALENTDPKQLPEPKTDTPDEWIRYLEARLRVEAPLDAEFKALRAPLADKEVADALNRDLDQTRAKAQEALTAAKAGTPGAFMTCWLRPMSSTTTSPAGRSSTASRSARRWNRSARGPDSLRLEGPIATEMHALRTSTHGERRSCGRR